MTRKKGNEVADNRRQWVSIVPLGVNQQHPRAYRGLLQTAWENRDNLAYA